MIYAVHVTYSIKKAMTTYSSSSFQRSGSSGSLGSKNSTKSVFFDSKTLQGMLGLGPASLGKAKTLKTKADRRAHKQATMSRNREYNRMVESILLEETGHVVKR